MPRKNCLLAYNFMPAANLATAGTTSAVVGVQYMDNLSMQFVWTGTSPVGTIAIQVSLDYAQNSQGTVSNAGTWTALTLSPSPSVSGDTGSWVVDLNQVGQPWIRAVYSKTSGTGTLNGYISGKEI